MDLPVVTSTNPVLPPLYDAWMAELLPATIPPETEATCDECAMCTNEGGAHADSGFFFEPTVKCCSFIPKLPNFLVGRALADDDPAAAVGRATLAKRLDAGVAVTPLGLGRHPDFEARYDRLADAGGFGRSREIRCPHYLEDGGLCGIWRHRDSTCSTWFCKHVRGAIGHTFWRTLQNLLATVEVQLAHWCVLELDPGVEALQRLFPPVGFAEADPLKAGLVDGIPAPELRRAMWGRWAGRERDFFKACAERVEKLNWSTVQEVCGPEVRVLSVVTREAFDRLTAMQAPSRLNAGPYTVLRTSEASVRVFAYSPTDPLEIPRPVMDVLHYFDGRATDEVLIDISSKTGIRLEQGLVRKLADFGLLVASKPDAASPS